MILNSRLVYDRKTRKTSNSPGVEIRQPGFGNTSSVEWLDASEIYGSKYHSFVFSFIRSSFVRPFIIFLIPPVRMHGGLICIAFCHQRSQLSVIYLVH